MPRTIIPLAEEQIPALSQFLKNGLGSPLVNPRFADPEVLRWKYFDPCGLSPEARSLVVVDNDKLLAHAGLCLTEFRWGKGGRDSAPAVHVVDWLTSCEGDALGAMLMLKAFSHAPIQYALGCSPEARAVLLRIGFEEILRAPLFHKVLSPLKPACWAQLHGLGSDWRTRALLLLDSIQNFYGTIKLKRIPVRLNSEPLKEFGMELSPLLEGCSLPIVYSERTPALLNHLLRYPDRGFTGWLLQKETALVGFALLTTIEKMGLRVGRISDCFLTSGSADLWHAAVLALQEQLRAMNCDVISCFGTTPWLSQALRKNGFFRRGRTAFYLRDPRRLIPRPAIFHLTHIEADLSYS